MVSSFEGSISDRNSWRTRIRPFLPSRSLLLVVVLLCLNAPSFLWRYVPMPIFLLECLLALCWYAFLLYAISLDAPSLAKGLSGSSPSTLGPLYEKTNAHGDKRLKPSDYELVRKIKEQVQSLPDLELPSENAYITTLEIDKWKKSKQIQEEVTLRTDCQAIISFYNKTNSNKSQRLGGSSLQMQSQEQIMHMRNEAISSSNSLLSGGSPTVPLCLSEEYEDHLRRSHEDF
nr:hypothetical protein [Tanacetum cinerariifolium]